MPFLLSDDQNEVTSNSILIDNHTPLYRRQKKRRNFIWSIAISCLIVGGILIGIDCEDGFSTIANAVYSGVNLDAIGVWCSFIILARAVSGSSYIGRGFDTWWSGEITLYEILKYWQEPHKRQPALSSLNENVTEKKFTRWGILGGLVIGIILLAFHATVPFTSPLHQFFADTLFLLTPIGMVAGECGRLGRWWDFHNSSEAQREDFFQNWLNIIGWAVGISFVIAIAVVSLTVPGAGGIALFSGGNAWVLGICSVPLIISMPVSGLSYVGKLLDIVKDIGRYKSENKSFKQCMSFEKAGIIFGFIFGIILATVLVLAVGTNFPFLAPIAIPLFYCNIVGAMSGLWRRIFDVAGCALQSDNEFKDTYSALNSDLPRSESRLSPCPSPTPHETSSAHRSHSDVNHSVNQQSLSASCWARFYPVKSDIVPTMDDSVEPLAYADTCALSY